MEMDVKLKVLGIIIACGFAAGFVIEQRASAMVDAPVHGIKMKKREIVDAGDEDEDDEGGSGGSKSGAEKRSNKAGGGEPNGNASASPASAGGGGTGKPKDAEQKKASADPKSPAQKPPEAITGRKAMDFIAGNTLKDNGAQGPGGMIFYASRGLAGHRDSEGFVVRKWAMKGDDLCETGAGAPVCRAIQIRLEGDGRGAQGAVIGHVVGADVDIVKGNVADFPLFIPGLEPKPKARQGFASLSSETLAPGLSGAAAFQAIVGKVLVDSRTPASLNRVYFDPEGAMLDIRRTSLQGEARVGVTAWALKKDLLCRDTAANNKPVCLRPQILDGGVLRLGTGAGAPTYTETQG